MLYSPNQKLLPSVDTTDFLPPVSRWTTLAGIFLVGTVVSATGLASWIKYDVTVKVPATVRPIGDIKIVQPQASGTVKSINAKVNEKINKGDVIANLDNEEIRIKNSQLQNKIQEGNLQLAQIDAQIKALDSQINAERLVNQTGIASAEADLARTRREHEDRQVKTQNDLRTAQGNLQQAQADLRKAETDLVFAIKERNRYTNLAKLGAVAKRLIDQKQLAIEQSKIAIENAQVAVDIAQANILTAKAAVNPSEAVVKISEERIAQEQAKGNSTVAAFRREQKSLLQQKIQMQNEIKQYNQELQKNQIEMQRNKIRATSDGILLKLNLRNVGQVVNPGEPIAEIVPTDAPLTVKAMLPAGEIDKVKENQKVQLRVDACPYPDYGTLQGSVKNISPDTVASNSTASTPNGSATVSEKFFEVIIQPKSESFGNHSRKCNIQTGMNATAQIISKQETALQYLLRKARLITDL